MSQHNQDLNSRKLAQFNRMFLIRLAPIYLACRWRVMGHSLKGFHQKPDLACDLQGMVDYEYEMRLVCRERMQCSST